MKSGMTFQPPFDVWSFVRGVVIQDQMHLKIPRHGGVDRVQELSELPGPMPLMKLRNQLTGLHVERRKQRRGAMPTVVVRAALDLPRFHRQEGLSPIEGLNLGLLIHAEHRRVLRRLLNTSSDIEAYCNRCNCFWPISGLEREGVVIGLCD